MNQETNILLNKFGQDLITFDDVYDHTRSLANDEKMKLLSAVINLAAQMKVKHEDVYFAKNLLKNKSKGVTALKLLEKEISRNIFNKILILPITEFSNSLEVLLSIFKIAYKNQRNIYLSDPSNNDKWWFNDFSDNVYLEKLSFMTSFDANLSQIRCNEGQIKILNVKNIPKNFQQTDKEIILERLKSHMINQIIKFENFLIFTLIKDDFVSLASVSTELDFQNLDFFEKVNISVQSLNSGDFEIGKILTLIPFGGMTIQEIIENRKRLFAQLGRYLNDTTNPQIKHSIFSVEDYDSISLLVLYDQWLCNDSASTFKLSI